MNAKEVVQNIFEKIQNLGVKTVYGEPVAFEGKTIIPVAKVQYGFGGGCGTETEKEGGETEVKEGSGGGGGVNVKPVGVVEITGSETRFISFGRGKVIAGAVLGGVLFGLLMSKCPKFHRH